MGTTYSLQIPSIQHGKVADLLLWKIDKEKPSVWGRKSFKKHMNPSCTWTLFSWISKKGIGRSTGIRHHFDVRVLAFKEEIHQPAKYHQTEAVGGSLTDPNLLSEREILVALPLQQDPQSWAMECFISINILAMHWWSILDKSEMRRKHFILRLQGNFFPPSILVNGHQVS